MRVLLFKSRSLKSKVDSFTPPLGVLYLAAYLRARLGAEVQVVDMLRLHDPAIDLARIVRETSPHLIGLSGLTSEAVMLHHAARIARSVRPDVPMFAGGPYPSSDPDTLLTDRNIDAAVIGEGEETLLDLARHVDQEGPSWPSPRSLAEVPGVAFRGDDGAVVRSASRPPIDDLDAIPWPDWTQIDPSWFWTRRSMATAGVRPYMPIFTSRGCPYRCTYCHNLFEARFRTRSPESVVEEIVSLHRRYGVSDFEFIDDSINLNKRRFIEILQGIEASGVRPKLHFPNGVRTDRLDEETIRLLHRVGAGEVSVAVETASPRLQALTRKHLNLDVVTRNIELMADLRVFMRGFFMLGYPTETEEELLATIDYAARSRLHLASFHVTNPFPGTLIHEEFKARGKLREDINPIDYEYVSAPFNGSEVPDARFQELFRKAYSDFYFQPGRMLRVLRDRPYHTGYADSLRSLIRKFAGFDRIREVLRS